MIVRLLSIANSGEYPGKREFFYLFKDRFLRRHATLDGYDKQIIQKQCFRCKGHVDYVSQCVSCRYQGGCWNCRHQDDDGHDLEDSYYKSINKCPKCGGSGWYVNKTIWLQRWQFRGRIFHIPVQDAASLPLLMPDPVNVFDGVIKHASVDGKKAWWAALALFAIYDLRLFLDALRESMKPVYMRPIWAIRQKYYEFRHGEIPF